MVATRRDNRKVIHVKYPCYICGEKCKTAATVINHATLKHGQRLPSRRIGVSRPTSSLFRYENDIEKDWEEQHHGCPSCWFHSSNFEEFQAHVEETHCDNIILNTNTSKDYDNKKKMVTFADDESESSYESESSLENKTEPDLKQASSIAQQIVDLGNILKEMLKI